MSKDTIEEFMNELEEVDPETVNEVTVEEFQEIIDNNSDDWYISLKNAPSELEFTDLNGEIEFKLNEIKDPDGNYTGKYMGFYKQKGTDTWASARNIVTRRRYVVALVDKFVKELKNNVDFNDTDVYNTSPFYSTWRNRTDTTVKCYDDETSQKIISWFIGVDEKDLNPTASIYIDLVNSYDGRSSLKLNYLVRFASNTGQEFVDYFMLSRLSQKISHTTSLYMLNTDLENIQDHLDETVKKFKEVKDKKKLNSLVDGIKLRLHKKAKAEFCDTIDELKQLDGYEYNLFSVLCVLSYALNKDFVAKNYTDIRTYVDNFTAKI